MAEGVAPHVAKAVPHLVKVKEKVVPHLVKEVTQVKEVATSAVSLPSLLLHTQVCKYKLLSVLKVHHFLQRLTE